MLFVSVSINLKYKYDKHNRFVTADSKARIITLSERLSSPRFIVLLLQIVKQGFVTLSERLSSPRFIGLLLGIVKQGCVTLSERLISPRFIGLLLQIVKQGVLLFQSA